MAIKQLKGRFHIKSVKMVHYRRFQFFLFHTSTLTFKISRNGYKLMRAILRRQSSKNTLQHHHFTGTNKWRSSLKLRLRKKMKN